ncbi:MAG: hypothetical protein GX872_05965 [Firmicutes bacterium]|nr:hypothetical protein [Bacillota bacterium]HXL03599.1 hypothetical protein [Bacillota bacterium]
MKKTLGIVLLVLALGLVSVPAFAQQVELNLKFWYAGVSGADEWVADYGEYEDAPTIVAGIRQLNNIDYHEHAYTETLMLQPGTGASFILSGEYTISPSISINMSYWGLSRADEVGAVLESDLYYVLPDISIDTLITLNGAPKSYWILVPLWKSEVPVSEGEIPKTVLAGDVALSMSALDVCATKTLSGHGWDVGLSAGVRRAAFNEALSTEIEFSGEWDEGVGVYGRKDNLCLDSKLNVTAIGPQVGIEGKYTLTDKLALKAGAKAGLLFGTAKTDALWAVKDYRYWDYEIGELNSLGNHVTPAQVEEDPDKWGDPLDSGDTTHSATDSIRINTFDLNASIAYQITEQWQVEAGYYASIWKGVPSPYFFDYNIEWNWNFDFIEPIYSEEAAWKQPEARDIIVSGLTLGVNFKF